MEVLKKYVVSVPFRGFVLSNVEALALNIKTSLKFPSPFGVLFCLILLHLPKVIFPYIRFPSPFGVLFCLI